jgi:hypothetical protein
MAAAEAEPPLPAIPYLKGAFYIKVRRMFAAMFSKRRREDRLK